MLRILPLLLLAACTRPNLAYEGGGEETAQATETGTALTEPGGTSTSVDDGTTGPSADTTGSPSTSATGGSSSESTSGGELPLPCDTDDPDLAACYHFPERELAVLVDGSPDPVNGTMVGLNALIGAPMGFARAADVGAGTRITVDETGETDDLDVTGEITFMALVWRRNAALQGRAGILDKERQYGLFLDESGRPSCEVAGGDLLGEPLPLEEWTHVACTFDGTSVGLVVNGATSMKGFHDGDILQNQGALEIAGNSPGDGNPEPQRLNGHIDAVEIWSRVLTVEEVCVRAGSVCAS